MRRKTTLFILAFMVSALAFSVIPAVAEEEEVHPFIYASSTSPEGLDPLGVYDAPSGEILSQCLETLYAFDYTDPSMKSIPLLAKSEGTFNADQTEWTIPLQSGVTWHDGTAFTASDVKWNFDRLNRLASSYLCEHASLWFNDEWEDEEAEELQLILKETVVLGDLSVKFVLNKPWLDFQALLPFWGASLIKPNEAYSNATIEFDNIDDLIGTGPFEFDSIVISEKTVLTQYEDYWQGPADLQQVIFQVFDSSATADQALFNQEVQAIRSLTYENLEIAEANPLVQYKNVKASSCYGFHLGVNSVPWHARKAMQYGFNYTYLIHTLLDDTVYEHHTPVPEGMFGYNGDIPGLPYFDRAKARGFLLRADSPFKTALDAAGIDADSTDDDWIDLADTNPIGTYNFTRYWGQGYMLLLQDFMSYCGIAITDNNLGDWGTFLNYCNNNENLGVCMLGWGPDYFAAVNQIEPLYGSTGSSNWNRLDNDTIDAKLAALHTIPQGPALQEAVDEVVQMVICEQAAGMYLYQNAEFVAYSSYFIDYRTMEDWWNTNLDKYMYGIHWNRDTVAPSWYGDPDWIFGENKPTETTTTLQVPGYSMGIFMALAIGAAAFLILRKRK